MIGSNASAGGNAGNRAGMSIVQLLATIAIVALLMAVLMPSLQQARESARRVQCLNNMRSLGTAMLAHASSQGTFPEGIAYPGPNRPGYGTDRRWGDCYGTWLNPLLAYLDHPERWTGYRNYANIEGTGFSGAMWWGDPANAEAIKPVPMLMCPSDLVATPTWSKHSYAVNFGNTGVNHEYACSAGLDYGPAPFLVTTAGGTISFLGAPFGHGKPRSTAWITDGMGNTLMAAEVIRTAGDSRGTTWYGSMGQFTTFLRPNDTNPDRTYWFACSTTPGDPPCVRAVMQPGNKAYSIYAARSRHLAGVVAGMCDGSSRFVDDAIDTNVWQAVSTARGGTAEPNPNNPAYGEWFLPNR